ncbi:MAG: DUF4130 domain-containing protein [Candidatus Lokiarchaeota archaeon]|nr:DUF4130 domain-containing protein [Candidatus Lokiarchaeota archaeon]MBD3201108.1 DUF4130 domain-containing protein [Candidatus Lokiarchaeota archaeon]
MEETRQLLVIFSLKSLKNRFMKVYSMYDDFVNKGPKRQSKDPLEVLGCSRGYDKQEILTYISRHEKFTPSLIKQIKGLPDVVLRNLGNPLARKIVKMMKEIGKESYRAIQFTRTSINDRGVLYGVVLLRHKVLDKVLIYFHQRWPQCVICLYNEHTQTTGIMNEKGKIKEVKMPLEEVVQKISSKRPEVPYFEDIQFSGKEIFETLYQTQSIAERENKRYFKQMIPDKCYELPGLRSGIEKRFNEKNKKMDDFF